MEWNGMDFISQPQLAVPENMEMMRLRFGLVGERRPQLTSAVNTTIVTNSRIYSTSKFG